MQNKIFILFFSAIIIIILYNAISWEANDIRKIYARKNVYEIQDSEKREKEYKFYATFNHENHIVWRSIFIVSVISSIIAYIFLKLNLSQNNLEICCFGILGIIFLTSYFNALFRDFHIYRVMASKIYKERYVMETIGEKKKKEVSK